jgi:Phage major capsid protein E
MPDFVYPSAIDLQTVAQELVPTLQRNRAIFDFMKTRNVDSPFIAWEQKNNYVGLQQVRGINGAPSRVKAIGGSRFVMEPGYYGEFMLIDERELTTRRAWGSFTTSINVSDLVAEKQAQLLQRRYDRIEWMGWTLAVTGTFAVADGTATLHTDSYTTQTYTAGVGWGTIATATPLADFRAVALKGRGYSVSFGAGAKAYMNQVTLNNLLANTNAADIAGRRGAGLATLNSLGQINELFGMDGLPTLVPYDRGYIDDTGTFQLYIPNNKVVVVGARIDNDPVMEYIFTRNVNNSDMGPGPYMRVIDDQDDIPRQIQVHDGHNGGIALYHPAAFVVMTV